MSVKKPSMIVQLKEFLEDGEDWGTMKVGIPHIALQKKPEYTRGKRTYPARLCVIFLKKDGSSYQPIEINLDKYVRLTEAIQHEKLETLILAVDKFSNGKKAIDKGNDAKKLDF